MEPVMYPDTSSLPGAPTAITQDLAYLRTAIANVLFFGSPDAGDRGWVLIDTGVFGFAGRIRTAAEQRFGPGNRPSAIVLTHGHFDHVGAARKLAYAWDAPIYAHELEMPYLTGQSRYPPGDSTVGGGAMAAIAWLYPSGPVDLRPRIQSLPPDGSVPGMTGWRWIHTPGHTPGHVSLFREEGRILVSGDAIVTVKQESLISVLRQAPEIHGPPAYFTPDWQVSGRSVQYLGELNPSMIASGHGHPLHGPALAGSIRDFARSFEKNSVPERGRYVETPAFTNADGFVWAPQTRVAPSRPILLALGATGLAMLWISVRSLSREPDAHARLRR